jgi:hypothetical protein
LELPTSLLEKVKILPFGEKWLEGGIGDCKFLFPGFREVML